MIAMISAYVANGLRETLRATSTFRNRPHSWSRLMPAESVLPVQPTVQLRERMTGFFFAVLCWEG